MKYTTRKGAIPRVQSTSDICHFHQTQVGFFITFSRTLKVMFFVNATVKKLVPFFLLIPDSF